MAAHPASPSIPTTASDTRFFGHPVGLSTLFFTELWERFSYYGMRAILILFMVAPLSRGGLGFPASKAGAIYGLYTSMVYLLSLPGGWIADRITGQRKAVVMGGVVIALGHFSMAVPSIQTFYFGLALIVLGTGLLKPNVSTMVGQLYGPGDSRRDAAFSIFYMGINLGGFTAPLACGYLGEKVNWHYGFGLAGVGMTLGLVQYVLGGKQLGSAGLHPGAPGTAEEMRRRKRNVAIGLGAALVIVAAVFLLFPVSAESVARAGGIVLMLVTVGTFASLFLLFRWTPEERNRLIVVVVLFVAACLFWANYEQQGSTMNLFADRNTRLDFLGYHYPASWFQSLSSFFVITLAPLFAVLWVRLGKRDPSSPFKFATGLVFVGLGFAILAPVAHGGRVSPLWLLMAYWLQTIGELLLSPVGLSAMTKLAPARIASFVMGIWFLADAIGNYIGGQLASVYEVFPLPQLFGLVGGVTLGLGVILYLLVPPVKKLMSGAN
jgi:proton-dependent oligopeptide transporter, POT family